jgi:cell division protein FtsZ
MIHFDMPREKSNIIKVLGFGGGGGNAVNHMYHQHIQNVDFIICNTDAQALQNSPVPNKIQLGPHLTQGLGAGANPTIGKQATEESLEEIRRILEINTKMAFITAGMGGGTGTGGAPTVAKICRDLGILTVGIVTTPFQFEGPRRMQQARQGIEELKEHVDTLLVISNDKLRHQFGNLKMRDAFAKADDVLSTAARCITDVINSHGQINVDFADVCTVMRNGGVAILGSATAAGENRALKAIESATNSPLLNDNDIRGAKWILLNITSAEGDHEYTMEEVEIIQNYVREQTGETTDVILGMGYDDTLGEQIGITIIATGFHHKDPFEKAPARKPEVKQTEEPAIFMTLGVEGEEKKMEVPVFTAPEPMPAPQPEQMAIVEETEVVEEEAFTLEMPVMEEAAPVEPEALYEPPVMDVLKTVETESAPIIFELSVSEEPFFQEEAEPVATSITEVSNETPAEEEAEAPSVPGFLNKPAQIYFEPAPSAEAEEVTAEKEAKEEESLMPVMQEMPEELPAAREEWKPTLTEEWNEEDAAVAGISLSVSDHVPATTAPEKQMDMFHQPDGMQDLSEDEEQKRRAKERINRLRNLSYNPHNLDNNSEFEQVPAYLRRDMNLHNSIANVEDFYSRAQVKSDDNNQGHISTLNNFLHGEKPD